MGKAVVTAYDLAQLRREREEDTGGRKNFFFFFCKSHQSRVVLPRLGDRRLVITVDSKEGLVSLTSPGA